MVWGAGDCQEVPQQKPVGNSTSVCYDERMSGKKISALINSRPPPSQFPWRNFAIWYCTYPGKVSNSKWGYWCIFEGAQPLGGVAFLPTANRSSARFDS